MHWSPFLDEQKGLGWDKIKAAGERLYGSQLAVDPLSDYEDKELAAIWNGHRSIMKDSVPVDDNVFPMILSYNSPDGMAHAGGMWGPDIEYHLFTSATGSQMTREEFELACERGFNLERAIQVRNFQRHRQDDESIIPHFEYLEWWQNPLLSEKKRLEAGKFIPMLEAYYRGRGWEVESGRPGVHKLRQLGLPDVAQELTQAGLIREEFQEEEVLWQSQ
jgi:aldehyde:ferredoxin oxidoreductase